MKWLSALLLSFYCFFAATQESDEIEELPKAPPAPEKPAEFKKFAIRVNPLILVVGGNFDVDFFLNPRLSLGPSFFGSGGCGSVTVLSKEPGYQCDTMISLGVRANYYSEPTESPHQFYVGPGVYNVNRHSQYRYGSNNILSGEFTSLALSALAGYTYWGSLGFGYVGVGGFHFLSKPSEITVSEGGVQTQLTTGPQTYFLYEVGFGFRF